MHDNKLRLVFVAVAIVIIVVALVIGGVITILSFKVNYTESISRSYQVAVLPAKRNIEYALHYGKPLSHFFGMDGLLGTIKNSIPEIDEISVAQPNGTIMYDLTGKVAGKSLPPELMGKANLSVKNGDDNVASVFFQDRYYYFVPLKDKTNNMVGVINWSVPRSVVQAYVDENVWTVMQSTVVIGITALNVLVYVLFAIPVFDSSGNIRKKRLIFIVSSVFFLSQMCYSLFNISLFDKSYEVLTAKNTALVTQSIGDDINSVLKKGISYNDLTGVDDYLDKIRKSLPELGGIAITDDRGNILYAASTTGNELHFFDSQSYSRTLTADSSGAIGKIAVTVSSQYILAKKIHVLLNSLVLTAVFLVAIPLVMLKIIGLTPRIRKWLLLNEVYGA